MEDLSNLIIPSINDSKTFERLCRDLWKNDKSYINVDLNGTSGQYQQGVDVFGRNKNTNNWFGIQCKVRESRLTKTEIKEEIEKAKNFNPKLDEYIICTTIKRDVKTQEIIREFNAETIFNIQVLFWDDIEELLKQEQNFNILHRYYHKFFADNKTLGHAIGKLIDLELGIGTSLDTHYELMIGKIPKFTKEKLIGVDYYQDIYFIINFHQKKMETFKLPCFESDIEQAFPIELDKFRITKWLNTIGDLDKFIYDNQDKITTYLSIDEYKKRIKEK